MNNDDQEFAFEFPAEPTPSVETGFDLSAPLEQTESIYAPHFEGTRTEFLTGALSEAYKEKTELVEARRGELIPNVDIDQEHLDKLNVIINTALDELVDRVKHGERILNRLTGEEDRQPVKAKVLNDIVKTLFERQDVSRARIRLKNSATSSNMAELVAALKGAGREYEVIDAELMDDGGKNG